VYHVYVLRSELDGNFYAGYTEDIAKRLGAHNTGSVISTKSRRPLQLILVETFLSKYDALRRERYFKTNDGKKMLKFILRDTLINHCKESCVEEIKNFQLQWKHHAKEAEVLVRG
jgi:putative endonuclease